MCWRISSNRMRRLPDELKRIATDSQSTRPVACAAGAARSSVRAPWGAAVPDGRGIGDLLQPLGTFPQRTEPDEPAAPVGLPGAGLARPDAGAGIRRLRSLGGHRARDL